MTCAYCNRQIPRKDIEAHRYVHSRFTGAHYCLRLDCATVHARNEKKAAA